MAWFEKHPFYTWLIGIAGTILAFFPVLVYAAEIIPYRTVLILIMVALLVLLSLAIVLKRRNRRA